MATYYATKSYVVSLTLGVYGELKKSKSNIYVGCLCPGPVDTEFNKVAQVDFSLKGLTSEFVAQYAIKKMFKKKTIIIPGMTMKLSYIGSKFLPKKFLLGVAYKLQKKKIGGN